MTQNSRKVSLVCFPILTLYFNILANRMSAFVQQHKSTYTKIIIPLLAQIDFTN